MVYFLQTIENAPDVSKYDTYKSSGDGIEPPRIFSDALDHPAIQRSGQNTIPVS
jgi:hypothetical protein